MLRHTKATCSMDRLEEWLLEEGVRDTQIISIQKLDDGSYLVWYRA